MKNYQSKKVVNGLVYYFFFSLQFFQLKIENQIDVHWLSISVSFIELILRMIWIFHVNILAYGMWSWVRLYGELCDYGFENIELVS